LGNHGIQIEIPHNNAIGNPGIRIMGGAEWVWLGLWAGGTMYHGGSAAPIVHTIDQIYSVEITIAIDVSAGIEKVVSTVVTRGNGAAAQIIGPIDYIGQWSGVVIAVDITGDISEFIKVIASHGHRFQNRSVI
jgi:hypothetical protein